MREATFVLKICFIFLIFAINFCGGLIPLLCKKCSANPKALSLLNAFASGVFLAMALCHI
jgi:zinc transporter ZupT